MSNTDQFGCTKTHSVAPQTACADKRIKLYPGDVVRALGLGTRKKDFDADELLDLLRKLRDGAVTDSNRIGELSSQLDAVTKKRDDLQWHNDRKDEQIETLKTDAYTIAEERDKAQEGLRKALAERNQARAAFRAAAQRLDFETICDLFCTMELPQ